MIASATGIPYSLSEAGWLENSPGAKSLTGGENKRVVMQKGMIRQSAGLRRRSGVFFFFFKEQQEETRRRRAAVIQRTQVPGWAGENSILVLEERFFF